MLEDIGRISVLLSCSAPLSREADNALPVRSDREGRETSLGSPFERVRLLQTLGPQIASALAALARQPDSRLLATPGLRKLEQVRGGPQILASLPRAPSAAHAWRRSQQGQSAPSLQDASSSALVVETRAETSFDTPANRAAASFLDGFGREALALAALAHGCGEDDMARDLKILAGTALHFRQTGALAAARPTSAPALSPEGSAAALARAAPPYRALERLHRQWNASLRLDWADPRLAFSTREPWQMYEIWLWLVLIESLQNLGWKVAAGEIFAHSPDGLRFALATGRASRLRFQRQAERPKHGKSKSDVAELFYQPLFVSANQTRARTGEFVEGKAREMEEAAERDAVYPAAAALSDAPATGYVSASHAMQPDFVLRWRNRLYLLDAKFRTYAEPGAEQNDIDKMHAYRDAIRFRDRPVSAAPAAWGLFPGSAVRAAWLLFPGVDGADDAVPGSAASLALNVRAYPAATPERPLGQGQIGALRLRPGDKLGSVLLPALLASWLV